MSSLAHRAFRFATYCLGSVVVVGCTRADHPGANAVDASPPSAPSAEPVDAAPAEASTAASADASTIDVSAAERDAGARKGPCAQCRADQYCLVIHASGGVARPYGHTTSTRARCEPFPGKARSCASVDPATGTPLAEAGTCVERDGRVRLEVMINAP